MSNFPKKLAAKLLDRKHYNSFRTLGPKKAKIDFSSNDYLGFSRSEEIFNETANLLKEMEAIQNGATGSRLLSGNYALYDEVEGNLRKFHDCEAALVFNSGYDANLGFFSAIPQRGDVVFYDDLVHASIRDGIKLGNAQSFKFKHNSLEDLLHKIRIRLGDERNRDGEVYVVTESVFSMDGDTPDLKGLMRLCEEKACHLVVDEAHALGVFGECGQGVIQMLDIHTKVFARLVTFGKALGGHGAAILGSKELVEYLTNYCRSFIYTTGLPPHTLALIKAGYQELEKAKTTDLIEKVLFFKKQCKALEINANFISSDSAVQCCIVAGNEKVKQAALKLQENGFDVRPILYPTVPKGSERLRFCVHSFNTEEEISGVVKILAKVIKNEK